MSRDGDRQRAEMGQAVRVGMLQRSQVAVVALSRRLAAAHSRGGAARWQQTVAGPLVCVIAPDGTAAGDTHAPVVSCYRLSPA